MIQVSARPGATKYEQYHSYGTGKECWYSLMNTCQVRARGAGSRINIGSVIFAFGVSSTGVRCKVSGARKEGIET